MVEQGNIDKFFRRSRSGASAAKPCEACGVGGDVRHEYHHLDRIINDHEKSLNMGLLGKFFPVVIFIAVLVALLLCFMMWEFAYNGLNYIAVVLGFGAVSSSVMWNLLE